MMATETQDPRALLAKIDEDVKTAKEKQKSWKKITRRNGKKT